MNEISLEKYADVWCVGDLHGFFDPFAFEIIEKKKLKDALVIVCGDCGFGFYKPNYYESMMNRISKKLMENNVCIAFIRGNHDDPAYFNGSSKISKFNNLLLVQDYSLLRTSQGNILCIGGARSIDKTRRQENISWWKGEMSAKPSSEALMLLDTHSKQIDFIAAHDTILESEPFIPNDKLAKNAYGSVVEAFSKIDINLKEDIYRNRELLSEILGIIQDNNSKFNVKAFVHGHYHFHSESDFNGTKIIGLKDFDMSKTSSDWLHTNYIDI